jgi:hypothetical protein
MFKNARSDTADPRSKISEILSNVVFEEIEIRLQLVEHRCRKCDLRSAERWHRILLAENGDPGK